MKKSIPTGNFAFFKGICMLPMIILAALNAFGQHEKLQTNPPVYSLGRYFDTVFDRFGNKFISVAVVADIPGEEQFDTVFKLRFVHFVMAWQSYSPRSVAGTASA